MWKHAGLQHSRVGLQADLIAVACCFSRLNIPGQMYMQSTVYTQAAENTSKHIRPTSLLFFPLCCGLVFAEEPPAEPPKWRVGVCLLNRPQGGSKSRVAGDSEKMASNDGGQKKTVSAAQGEFSPGHTEADTHIAGQDGGRQTMKAREQIRETEKPNAYGQLVGEMKFHVAPEVASHADDNKPDEPEAIQIRHFIDAGWTYTRYIRKLSFHPLSS